VSNTDSRSFTTMPPKPAARLCADFLTNKCTYGDQCRFLHDGSFCRSHWVGKCTYAERCKFRHDFPELILRMRPTSVTPHPESGQRQQQQQRHSAPPASAQQPQRVSLRHAHASTAQRQSVAERDASSDDEYGSAHAKGNRNKRGGGKGRNTENFMPSHAPADVRIVVDLGVGRMTIRPQVRDITLHPLLFTQPGDETLYQRLTAEVEAVERTNRQLLKSWHGDSHWIVDDATGWKKQCPTFQAVIERIRAYFNMDIKATRFNWYKDQSEWKPFHHDAAAVKPDKARTQNFTVGVSFGCTRDAAFEEAETKKVISMPLTNGSTYCFARDTNILWRHGILQVPPEQQKAEGRVSIIAWGLIDLDEVNAKPARLRA
jgi:hypothetical protein